MAAAARSKLGKYVIPLQNPDVAMAMQGWNKVLEFKESFSEAMMIRWRLEIAFAELEEEASAVKNGHPLAWWPNKPWIMSRIILIHLPSPWPFGFMIWKT
jgi:hypothetical protein